MILCLEYSNLNFLRSTLNFHVLLFFTFSASFFLGTINVSGAEISFEDRTSFTVTSGSNIAWHLKATSEVERQRWIHGLELARAGQPRFSEEQTDSDSEGEDGSSPDGADLKQIANKLNDLKVLASLLFVVTEFLDMSRSDKETCVFSSTCHGGHGQRR